jgi:hypothetical protein
MGKKRRQTALWMGIFGIIGVLVIFLLINNSKTLGIGGLGVLVLLVLIRVLPNIIKRRVDRKLKEAKRADRGAVGEEKIGDILSGLGEDFIVMHDVACPNGNIDHIIISKTNGLYLIETKAHGGKVEINGDLLLVNGKIPEKDFIAQTLRNTYWLRDGIKQTLGVQPWITSIIVFTNAFVIPAKPIKGIRIINKKYLLQTVQQTGKPNPENIQIWAQKERILSWLDKS